MGTDDVFSSWFEDGPLVQKTLALPRKDRIGMIGVVTEILPAKRGVGRAVPGVGIMVPAVAEAKQRARARDLVLVAHALAGDAPVGEIPMMGVIAENTVRAMLLGGW